MSLTFTDIFCGAGGSSIGLTAAGFDLKFAANHWDRAIETHAANIPRAEHVCADVNNYDMRRLPATDVLWASPICTENSPAGGNGRGKRSKRMEASWPSRNSGTSPPGRLRTHPRHLPRRDPRHRSPPVQGRHRGERPGHRGRWELLDWWCEGMMPAAAGLPDAGRARRPRPHRRRGQRTRGRSGATAVRLFTRNDIPLPDVTPRPLAWCRAARPTCRGTDVEETRPGLGQRSASTAASTSTAAPTHAGTRWSSPTCCRPRPLIDWTHLGVRIGDRDTAARGEPLRLSPRTDSACAASPERGTAVHR